MKIATRVSKIELIRALPLAAVLLISLGVAGGISAGRKPFNFDVRLTSEKLIGALSKIEHLKATALMFSLACLAFGTDESLFSKSRSRVSDGQGVREIA
jgi:hypothetical protein